MPLCEAPKRLQADSPALAVLLVAAASTKSNTTVGWLVTEQLTLVLSVLLPLLCSAVLLV
jgi:hypothetical protein